MTSLIEILELKGITELSKDSHIIEKEKDFNDPELFSIYGSIFEVISRQNVFVEMFLKNRWYYGVRKIDNNWYHVFKKIGEDEVLINITIDI